MALVRGIEIDYSRDSLITPFGLATLKDRYLIPGERSPQEAFARAATAYADDLEHAQRLYDYASKLWFGFSTPVLSNGGTERGLGISCFLGYVPDSRRGLTDHYTENAFLSSLGGGIGGYWGAIRSDGAATSKGSVSSGSIPFVKVVDSEIMAFHQGGSRRGSYVGYQDVWHSEFPEFLDIRKPTGGDINRKALNIHNAVNLSDDFMESVESGKDFDLKDPHTGTVTSTHPARDLWQKILETRVSTGEPYCLWIDTVNRNRAESHKELNLQIYQSNLCVSGETLILTDKGNKRISELSEQEVNVWNGVNFSKTKVVQTSQEPVKLITVTFSDGMSIDCTEYHKFHLRKGFDREGTDYIKEAKDLKEGEKVQKCNFPIIEFEVEMQHPYTQGFFSGDGCTYKGKNHIDLYGEKMGILPLLKCSQIGNFNKIQDRIRVAIPDEFVKYEVPHEYAVSSKVLWLAGLFDSDGTLCQSDNSQVVQVASIHKEFLLEIKLMLQTIGIQSKVTLNQRARKTLMPDGRGGQKEYDCKTIHRLLIGSSGIVRLQELGLITHRLKLEKSNPNRNAERFVTVVSVEDKERFDMTYCFNEPVRHMGIFNGILAGNCSEIVQPTNNERTAACCLSSVNLELYDDWKDNELFIEDLIRMLDNVISDFVSKAPPELNKAAFSAAMERSLGLGAMGFHFYLQKNNIPFESPIAKGINLKQFELMKTRALAASEKLAEEKGAAPDITAAGVEKPRRNVYLIAIAPNASSSIICGETSPSIEPCRANAFTHKTMSGSFLVKNKFLEQRLEQYGKNDEDTWKSIITNAGSVQHLDFLTEWEKDVFKTALEIDQHWIIQHAADRQPFICQSQSLNLFFPANTNIKYLHSVHMMAWKSGVKSLYYCRSESISRPDLISKQIERVQRNDYEECFGCQG